MHWQVASCQPAYVGTLSHVKTYNSEYDDVRRVLSPNARIPKSESRSTSSRELAVSEPCVHIIKVAIWYLPEASLAPGNTRAVRVSNQYH